MGKDRYLMGKDRYLMCKDRYLMSKNRYLMDKDRYLMGLVWKEWSSVVGSYLGLFQQKLKNPKGGGASLS